MVPCVPGYAVFKYRKVDNKQYRYKKECRKGTGTGTQGSSGSAVGLRIALFSHRFGGF